MRRGEAKAFRYNVMAGNKCLGVYGDEAERYFRKALDVAGGMPGATQVEVAEVVERIAYLLNLDTRPTPLCELLDRYLSRIEGSAGILRSRDDAASL